MSYERRDRSRSRERSDAADAPAENREKKGPGPDECKLFIGNLSFDVRLKL